MSGPQRAAGGDSSHEGPRVGSILWERLGADVAAEHEEHHEEEAQERPDRPWGSGSGATPREEPVPADADDEILGDVEVLDDFDDDEDQDQDQDQAVPGRGSGDLSPEDEAVLEAEEAVSGDIARLTSERDDYLDQLLRLKADFDNYRKRVLRQQTEHLERAAEGLVEKLLEVLDTFDAALTHGEGFDQVHGALVGVLEREGLARIDPEGEPFDPTEADAVAHEEGDGGPVVARVLRPGYRWKGRVVRPAMVQVRG